MRKVLIVVVALLMVGTVVLMIASIDPSPVSSGLGIRPSRPALSSTLGTVREAREDLVLDYAGKLIINNKLGAVYIQGANTDQIEVRVVKKARTVYRSANQLLDQIRVDTEVTDEATEIVTHIPNTTGNDQASVDLYLTVPSELVAELTLNLGKLSIADLHGTLNVKNNLGEVDIRGFEGDAFIEANLGDITITDSVFTEELYVNAALGDVSIAAALANVTSIGCELGDVEIILPRDQSYALEAEVGLGRFNLSVPFTGDRSKNSLRGIIGTGDQIGSVVITLQLGSLGIRH